MSAIVRPCLVVLLLVSASAVSSATSAPSSVLPTLAPETDVAWQRYVAAVEARRVTERRADGLFLASDFGADGPAVRRALQAGKVVIERGAVAIDGNHDLEVPRAMAHHWRGAIFLPGVTLDELLESLRDQPPPQEDVLAAEVLSRSPDAMRVYLRLRRTKIVTAFFDTEHIVRFERISPRRAESRSVATKIVEISGADAPRATSVDSSRDRGFLWRLNAYWRYEQVPGGVIAECESMSLSRSVPFGLRTIAGPIINSTARESLEKALGALRSAGVSR